MLLPFFVAYALVLTIALGLRGFRSGPGTSAAGTAHPVARVLVVGATGGTGRQLVAQALERGYDVTALVRKPDALGVQHPRLRVVQGDVLDAATVDQAVLGQDAVVCALGHKRYFGPTRILSEGTRNLLAAMEGHGVRRFVCETSLGIGDSAGRMGLYYTLFVIPVVLPFYFWDKTRQEQAIAASRADWVIVRPGALTNGGKRTTRRLGRRLGSFLATVRISRADVAGVMLDQATDATWVGSAVSVYW
jgi:uncharacterized protein YbjT (DUF2867 family)